MRVLLPCALVVSAATSMQLSRIGFFIFNCKDALIRYAGFLKGRKAYYHLLLEHLFDAELIDFGIFGLAGVEVLRHIKLRIG